MIPPAPVQSTWTKLATAALLPLTLLGLGSVAIDFAATGL